MKFYNWLNEERIDQGEYDNILSTIIEDCQPFLKQNKTDFLYSGRKYKSTFAKTSIRKNRNPLDTPLIIHDIVNSELKKKFGIKLRSESMFCKANLDAGSYGHIYLVFPIGDYNLYYSDEYSDLYVNIKEAFYKHKIDGRQIRNVFNSTNNFKNIWVYKYSKGGAWIFYSNNSFIDMSLVNADKKTATEKILGKLSDEQKETVEFFNITRKFVNDIIRDWFDPNTFTKTKKVPVVSTMEEIMLHCKDVYLLSYYNINNLYGIDRFKNDILEGLK